MNVKHFGQSIIIRRMSELGTAGGNLRPSLPRLFERDSLPHNLLRGTFFPGYPRRDVTELPTFGVFAGQNPVIDLNTEANSVLSSTCTRSTGVPRS